MTDRPKAYVGATVFDGRKLLHDHALIVAGDTISALLPTADIAPEAIVISLEGGLLVPGFVDLQVNGGGGVMFNDDPSVATLRTIAAAHAGLGTTALLPTLITDTRQKTEAAINAAIAALAEGVAGIAGLHLEGPHLSLARKGAHDPALIRPMEQGDLEMLLDAARRLPAFMVTLAPENTTLAQVRQLADAGVVVSLGHSDADYETCLQYVAAGARNVTHLFNAMSQLQNRAPGLVGAALRSGEVSAGLIADGIHVHPASIAVALDAKQGPGGLFLVTDAMAVAGTDLDSFQLDGREIRRSNGRLTLSDGTLAGADLELGAAIRLMHDQLSVPLETALAMATSRPAELMNMQERAGYLRPGARADFIHLNDGFQIRRLWQAGQAGGALS